MMPPEGPNKAEELLQRYAKKRREQAPDFSLHPATRRVLQGEVARQHGSSSGRKASLLSWFGTWRARMTFGLATASAILILTLMTWHSSKRNQEMQLAMSKSVEETLEDRSERATKQEMAEVGKQVESLSALPLSTSSGSGIRSKEKSSADTRVTTESLSPVQNTPSPTGPVAHYFADYGGLSGTNGFDGYTTMLRVQNATPAATPPVQLSYSFNGAGGGQRGFSSPPQAAVLADSEINLDAQLGRVMTTGVML